KIHFHGEIKVSGFIELKRNSKNGFPLYMPTLCAYRFNAFPKLINNLKKAGKPKMVIIVAIMRKLAKPAYYIVKTGQPYDAERH
ncbi:TPA: hypothetical protein ACKJY1_002122, partial [Neisseria gonorrhoeae]